jgi:hypothetical protein
MYYAGRAALNRGFLGGSPGWRAFGVAYFGLKFVRRAFGKTPEIVAIDELERGQTISITAIDPKTLRRGS